MGKFGHPEITMHTHPLSDYMDYIEKDDWDNVAALMVSSAKKLASAGAASRYAQTTQFTEPLKKQVASLQYQ